MKYLFLDCYAFLSPQMLASALYDITKNKDKLKRLCAQFEVTSIQISEEKRCGMEAELITLDYETETTKIKKENFCAICEKLDTSETTKEKLLNFIDIIAQAKSMEPDFATFEAKSAIDSLIFTAYALEIIQELKTDAIYVSKLIIPSPEMSTQDMSQKISDSLYILKNHGISTSFTVLDAPSFSESWAAMISVLNPILKASNPGDIIRIGYGAGEDEIREVPNILRAVYGEENNDDIIFEAEEALNLNYDFA